MGSKIQMLRSAGGRRGVASGQGDGRRAGKEGGEGAGGSEVHIYGLKGSKRSNRSCARAEPGAARARKKGRWEEDLGTGGQKGRDERQMERGQGKGGRHFLKAATEERKERRIERGQGNGSRRTLKAATEASLTMTLASLRPAQMISMKLWTCTLKTAGAFSAISRRMSTAA